MVEASAESDGRRPAAPDSAVRSRSRRAVRAVAEAGAALLLLVLAGLLLTHYHHACRTAALAITLRDFPYRDRESCWEYLRKVGRAVEEGLRPGEGRIDGYIRWIRAQSPLLEGRLNHPNPVYVIEKGGCCGQFSSVLIQLARANGIEARQVLLNWGPGGSSHVIIEAKVGGRWVAFDPLGFGEGPPGSPPITHVEAGGLGLSALELYRNPDVLPDDRDYGRDYFRMGRGFKVEPRTDYRALVVTPKFAYGRDWPLVEPGRPETADWLYAEHPPAGLQSGVTSHVFPYFLRLTFWFGPRPLILHFEWLPLALAGAGYLLFRFRGRAAFRYRMGAAGVVAALFAAYTAAVIVYWAHRYSA